jgi:RNA polymerase sigma factor (sigma-70 family)
MDWTDTYARLAHDNEDAIAWRALRQHVAAWVHTDLRRLPWHLLEDLVADTCSSVAVSFAKARGAGTFGGFVYGCYLNERRRLLLGHRGRSGCVGIDDVDEPAVDQGMSEVFEQQSPVWELLALLPARQRAAVTMRHLEGMSAEEIALQLGVSTGNARQLVFKGLLALRRLIESERSRITTPTR